MGTRIFNSIDIGLDFFEVYPDLAIVPELAEVAAKDKRIVWVAMFFAAKCSSYRNMRYEDIVDIVESEYVEKGFCSTYRADIRVCMELVRKLEETPVNRHMRVWEQKLEEKTKYLESIEYNLTTFEDIDRMLLSNEKIFKVYEALKAALAKEDSSDEDGKMYGSGMESLSESGEI